jgi:hypothetical protein
MPHVLETVAWTKDKDKEKIQTTASNQAGTIRSATLGMPPVAGVWIAIAWAGRDGPCEVELRASVIGLGIADLGQAKENDMTFRTASAVLVVFLATAVWAQSTAPVTVPAGGRQPVARTRPMLPAQSQTNGVEVPATPRQRVQAMEETLTRMHGLLKQMRAKAASSGSRDPLAKANLDMWELMLGQLDQQFDQLRIATLRADLEARRSSLYKQADERAAAAARLAAAQGSGAAAEQAAGTTGPGTEANRTGQAAPAAADQNPQPRSASDAASPKQE